MSIKKIVIAQYRAIVDRVAKDMRDVTVPKEGWIKTVRKALNMSVTQLANRLEVTRANVYKVEKAEQSGSVTLKKMEQMAKALECRFIYAIVPYGHTIDSMIENKAKRIAAEIVIKTNEHMALEAQSLSMEQIDFEVDRVAQEILRDRPSDIWNEK
jgi:predicted DNA-binding mobile mystery protein A